LSEYTEVVKCKALFSLSFTKDILVKLTCEAMEFFTQDCCHYSKSYPICQLLCIF